MAYTQADLDALRAAKKSGASRVELPSIGVVNYRTLDELERIESQIIADINAAIGKKPIRRVKVFAVKDL